MIGTLLIETPDVSFDVADELFLVRKIRFPYQGTITKHPHARSLATSVERFLFIVDDNDDHVVRQCRLCLMSRVMSSSFNVAT